MTNTELLVTAVCLALGAIAGLFSLAIVTLGARPTPKPNVPTVRYTHHWLTHGEPTVRRYKKGGVQ